MKIFNKFIFGTLAFALVFGAVAVTNVDATTNSDEESASIWIDKAEKKIEWLSDLIEEAERKGVDSDDLDEVEDKKGEAWDHLVAAKVAFEGGENNELAEDNAKEAYDTAYEGVKKAQDLINDAKKDNHDDDKKNKEFNSSGNGSIISVISSLNKTQLGQLLDLLLLLRTFGAI